jgi:phospholipase C
MNTKHRIISVMMIFFIAAGCSASKAQSNNASSDLQRNHKIQHIIVIMQENRSCDYYFGIDPGADGIPTENGLPTVCSPCANHL